MSPDLRVRSSSSQRYSAVIQATTSTSFTTTGSQTPGIHSSPLLESTASERSWKNKATYWVSGIQMRYMDAAMVGILKQAIFRFVNNHGDVETFCSTSDTRLRVLKMGDETQLHLESAKKLKLD